MQVLLEDISRTLGACAVTLPGCQDDTMSSAAVPQALHAYNQRHRQPLGFSLMSEHIPVYFSRLSLSNIDNPPAAMPHTVNTTAARHIRGNLRGGRAGPGGAGGAGTGRGSGRGLRNVSASPYGAGIPSLMTPAGGMERPLA